MVAKTEKAPRPAATRPLDILSVDDDELQQLLVRRALQAAGHTSQVSFASDGKQALEVLRSSPDSRRRLVLLDVHMPRMGGIEFLQQVRADPKLKRLMVVMLTSCDNVEEQREALALNVAGYLYKATNFPKFVSQLRVMTHYWSMMEIP